MQGVVWISKTKPYKKEENPKSLMPHLKTLILGKLMQCMNLVLHQLFPILLPKMLNLNWDWEHETQPQMS